MRWQPVSLLVILLISSMMSTCSGNFLRKATHSPIVAKQLSDGDTVLYHPPNSLNNPVVLVTRPYPEEVHLANARSVTGSAIISVRLVNETTRWLKKKDQWFTLKYGDALTKFDIRLHEWEADDPLKIEYYGTGKPSKQGSSSSSALYVAND